MTIIYIFTAIFIAWIWVDYYRLIDVFQTEKLKYFILTFLLGSASVFIVFWINRFLLDGYQFALNGDSSNDFAYAVFKIGLVEEFAKTVPFLIVLVVFKKQFNEPIDYLAFICVSALGFSAAENVLYFHNYGPYIINGRAILSSVGHMFDTSLIAYGIIRYKYYYKGSTKGILNIVLFVFLAALSHGFYDFWLISGDLGLFGSLLTILYFLICISFFAVIINNALNNSSIFTYKKVVNSDKVVMRLLKYYGIVFLIQLIILSYLENALYAFVDLLSSLLFVGFIVGVTCIRLSRFKLIKGRWEPINIELPFSMKAGDLSGGTSIFKISVKGETFNEAFICSYFEEFFMLNPLSQRATYIGNPCLSFIEKKIFLRNDESFYVAKLYHDSELGSHDIVLLKPKTRGVTMVDGKYPIVAILEINNLADLEDKKATVKNFKFKE
ncbi:MAG: PrsW family glutamic-type intramembrane protease, partial [Crocinitomicaceae bacterium]